MKPTLLTSGQVLLAAGAVAICCAAPLLIAALAATGIGAWLLVHGTSVLAACAVALGAALGIFWFGRRRSEQREDCCAPTRFGTKEKS